MSSLAAPAFRADIQGLRAVAVTLVLVYHLAPSRLTGGFVGVDVFFVISGFLITSHLLQHPPRGRSDLAQFWARRIRRLLPAAFLVLAFTAVASRLVAPPTQWEQIATEIVASALYVQNWALAATSVDYLAADGALTPTQHFWSLAVEEQFYLFWPLLILAVYWLAERRQRSGLAAARLAMLGVVGASLTVSVIATATEPASAYFITPTRVWELAVGGVLATLPSLSATRIPSRVVGAAAWAGIVLIVIAAVALDGSTPFPGMAALVPVAGSALVIAAAANGRWSPAPLLALRPVQHMGDISYSVYLWHWPLIALAPYLVGEIGWRAAVAIAVATVVLATATKAFVEDPFRSAAWLQRVGTSYRFAAAGMVAIVAISAVQLVEVRVRAADAASEVAAAQAAAGDCFGAAAIARGPAACPGDGTARIVPEPLLARTDRSDAYRDDCWTNAPYTERTTCTYGDGPIRVALVGNSHAGHWLPALQVLAEEHGWTITTYLVSQCNATDGRLRFDTSDKAANCQAWGRWVLDQTSGDAYDLVITSERQSLPLEGHTFATTRDAAAGAYASYLTRWAADGTNIVVLRDTPDPGRTLKSVPDCLAENAGNPRECAGTSAAWAWMDPLADAARTLGLPTVRVADLTGLFCTDTTCPAVIGSVVVYFDASHMTATYARTLAPYLWEALAPALRE